MYHISKFQVQYLTGGPDLRLTDYYNIFAAVLFLILVGRYLYSVQKNSYVIGYNPFKTSDTMSHYSEIPFGMKRFFSISLYDWAMIGMLVIGCFLRLWRLSSYPYGFNQDEASIGYDGWSILTYGIDRNGFHNPVYPITWGSGGGSPLMVYLVGISQKIFGSTVFGVRFPIAVAGCIAVILFALFMRLYYGEGAGFAAAFVISLNPWHFMQSRWTLDCNMTPLFILVSMVLFLAGTYYQKTVWYVLSAASFALCLYTYGSTTIVIPIYLLIICGIAIKRGILTVRQFGFGIITFLVVVLPLALFYSVNYLGLPEINASWISVSRFVSKRSIFITFDGTLPGNLIRNFLYIINVCTIGWLEPYNELCQTYLPSYVTMYRFTFPVTILGLGLCVHKTLQSSQKKETIIPEELFIIHFLVSGAFSLFIQPGISRNTLLFLNVIFFQVTGLKSIFGWALGLAPDTTAKLSGLSARLNRLFQSIPIASLIILIWAGSSILFFRDYFGHEARQFQTYGFMPLYGEAVEYAELMRRDDQQIISTKHSLVEPYMLALFFSHTSPYDFLETSDYINNDSEYRETDSFTHYQFVPSSFESEILKEQASPDDILIVHREETGHFSEEIYSIHQFEDYYVLIPK